jgi:peptidoglycan L-alanyl-D-glutamate endopeptidase CwlK
MSRNLNDLSSVARIKIDQVLARLKQAGIDITIIDVLRTPKEQEDNIRRGVSWTKNSKHLPDKNGKSNAIDIAPTELLKEKNWAPASPLWQIIGQEAKAAGLKWGGDWKQKDMGHLEV